MRIRGTASVLGPPGRGAARLLMESVLAAPRRIYIGASVAALVVGIGANALLLQIGRHPAPLLAPVTSLPASTDTAAPAGTVDPVAPHVSPTPMSEDSTASTAAPPAAGDSRATQASAPDTTSSIGPTAQDKQHQSSAPLASKSERGPVALAPERGKRDDRSRLVHAAQIALAKLGYAVKPDGAEDGATRRALRHFERAHGLAPTTNISPHLVKQLTAAAGG